jgi:hypothetical protein
MIFIQTTIDRREGAGHRVAVRITGSKRIGNMQAAHALAACVHPYSRRYDTSEIIVNEYEVLVPCATEAIAVQLRADFDRDDACLQHQLLAVIAVLGMYH